MEDICENMQLFPKQDFLTGDQLMFEYQPEVGGSHSFVIVCVFMQNMYVCVYCILWLYVCVGVSVY